jgi:MFS family permease
MKNKNKRFIEKKIESILMKRYALEKIISLRKFFWVFFLTFISFMIFFVFWLWVANYETLHNVDQFNKVFYLGLYAAVLIFLLVIGYVIWRMIGNYIPKFVLIGLLGWFLIGGGLISNIVVPGGITDPQPKTGNDQVTNLHLPATRFTGLHETSVTDESKNSLKNAAFHKIVFNIETLDQFLTPSIKSQKDPKILNEIEFTSLRLLIFFLLLLVLINLFLTVTMFNRSGKSRFYLANLRWIQRESAVKVNIGIIVILSIGLFHLTLNYLFLFTFLLALANIFLIKWEIQQRGQNHKIFTRSVLFLFLIQFFSMVAGEIFFLIYLPVFIYITKGNSQVLSMHDAIMLSWIVLVGSLASALIGMTTQVVWSGRRLTERFN